MKEGKHEAAKGIKMAFFLNLFFSIFELIGGIFTNSVSIISDSVHDFGDAISIAIAWWLEKKSNKKPNEKYTYGYARYSILGALVTTVVLLIGSVVMLYNAVPRLINPQEINYDGMIILGIVGFIINGIGSFITAKGEKINEKAVSLHLLEDVLGWVAVLVVSIVMRMFNLPILDPILSIGITIFILYNVFKNLKDIFEIFLEKAPDTEKFIEFKNEIMKNNVEIIGVHHIHIWSMDGEKMYVTMHVILKDGTNLEKIIEIKNKIKKEASTYGIAHITIEMELEKENCAYEKCEPGINIETHHHH